MVDLERAKGGKEIVLSPVRFEQVLSTVAC